MQRIALRLGQAEPSSDNIAVRILGAFSQRSAMSVAHEKAIPRAGENWASRKDSARVLPEDRPCPFSHATNAIATMTFVPGALISFVAGFTSERNSRNATEISVPVP